MLHKPLCLSALIGLALLSLAGGAVAGKIYKTVDEHGNVVFSDIAPTENSESAELDIEAPNTFASEAPEPPEWARSKNGDSLETEVQQPDYSVRITSPEPNEALRNNAGDITLWAATQPERLPGHRLRFWLDGVAVGTTAANQLPLSAVDRGTHQVKVEVISQDGDVISTSEPVTFHLQRYSKLFKKPAPPAGGGR